MDPLSDILRALELGGTLYFTTDFTPPWGVRVPALGRAARFHLVIRGRTWISVGTSVEPVELETGDLVLVPHGAEHVLADAPGREARDVDRVVAESGFTGRGALMYGGDDAGGPTRLVCGHFTLDADIDHPLLDHLPPLLVVRHDDTRAPIGEIARLISREATSDGPGSHALIVRLSEALFIQVIRGWAERSPSESGILAALADPALGESLALMHGRPAERWTLERLAREVGLSRTVFADRFRQRVGMAPMQYLTLWRLQRARVLLTRTDLTLEAIAGRVGYDSGPSLHKVFKRWIGETPGRYRAARRVPAVEPSPTA